jgi:hypothetical protein
MCSADFNNDGYPDLATAHDGAGVVAALINHGNGTYHDAEYYGVEARVMYVGAGEINGDDYCDLVVATWNPDGVAFLLNNGDGTFADPVFLENTDCAGPIAAVDLDDDGDNDLAVAHMESEYITIFLNDGSAVFTDGGMYGVGVGEEPRSMIIADLNGDGGKDLIVTNHNTDNISILFHEPPVLCSCPHQGDCDGNGNITPIDVVLLVDYALRGGAALPTDPDCPAVNRGEWNCDGHVNLIDLVMMINYVYRQPAPGPCDPCAF